jgi:hypothetical protein
MAAAQRAIRPGGPRPPSMGRMKKLLILVILGGLLALAAKKVRSV